MTHDAAEAACQTLGSNLATIGSEAERRFIRSLVLKETVDETTLTSLWIGLRKKSSFFLWSDLSDYDDAGLNQSGLWAAGQPKTDFLNEAGLAQVNYCAVIQSDAVTLSNNTVDFCKVSMNNCAEVKGFICQKVVTERNCGCN